MSDDIRPNPDLGELVERLKQSFPHCTPNQVSEAIDRASLQAGESGDEMEVEDYARTELSRREGFGE